MPRDVLFLLILAVTMLLHGCTSAVLVRCAQPQVEILVDDEESDK